MSKLLKLKKKKKLGNSCNLVINDKQNLYNGPVVMGVQKSVLRQFLHHQDYLQCMFFCNRNYRQNAISGQILETYQLYKAKLEKHFFIKRFTIMLLYMYQIFIFCVFFFHFYGVLFLDTLYLLKIEQHIISFASELQFLSVQVPI